MKLTDIKVRNARPGPRPIKLFDGGGMFLLVKPNGGKYWRLKYRINGAEKQLALGVYPDVPLKRAREKRDEARRRIADGVDPNAERKATKLARAETLEAMIREYLDLHKSKLAAVTYKKRLKRFEDFVFPYLGKRPIRSISAADLLQVLKRIEARGKNETAHRVRSEVGQVFRYAIATSRADRDISADLRGALAPVVVENHPAITNPSRIGELMRAIDGYRGQPATEAALKLLPLVFTRTGELRFARWDEFELDGKEPIWRIPAERMKMREPHIVPLSQQAVAVLKVLQPITGPNGLVFPSIISAARPISENTVNAALRRLGFSGEEMTGHGFRSMASTCLNEMNFPPDVIELQLAHAERDEVRGAYNRARRLPERRNMMQRWADYLDRLKHGADIINIDAARK